MDANVQGTSDDVATIEVVELEEGVGVDTDGLTDDVVAEEGELDTEAFGEGLDVDLSEAVEGTIVSAVATKVAMSVNEKAYELLDANNKDGVSWNKMLAPVSRQTNESMHCAAV